MRKAKILLLLLCGLSAQAQVPHYSYDPLQPDSVHYEVQTRVTQFLKDYHYKKFDLDDTLSSHVWDSYLNTIDGGKLYFTQADIDGFEKYRYTLDEAMQEGNLEAAFAVFNLYRTKYKARSEYILSLLDKPFDYFSNKTILADREKATWAKSEAELDEEWNKIILNQALSLKLTGKTDSAIAATLKSRYVALEKRTSAFKADNAFHLFMNAFTEYLDPHTAYMIPDAADQFNISMSQSIEGIGATLTNEGDYVVIKSIVPGGPLFKNGEGNVDDYIVAVAQGDDGEFQDIIGWLTDDAIKLIRGKKGSVVRLKLVASSAPLGTTPRTIRIVRDKINLEEAVAKGEIVDLKHDGTNLKIGVIDIPMFYRDFEYANRGGEFQSTTADVKRILDDFNQKKVDGVLIDLRNNGGGSLIEAIDLTGLFIKSGPVVQRKSSIGPNSVESDEDKSVSYEGPLVVLQNRFSASASEIFAGAIQDYQRGLIVGENSFGKGTVQQLVNLDSYFARLSNRRSGAVAGVGGAAAMNRTRYGQLKFTSEKFYRITGNSNQLKGVAPDVTLPSPFTPDEMGEKSYERALPYDQIRPVPYQKVGTITNEVIQKINDRLSKRLKSDEGLKELLLDIEEYRKEREVKEYSLNYDVRKKALDDAENKKKSIKKLNKSTKLEDKDNDIYLLESEKILGDLITLRKS
ncbi:carboxyl-terminal protease [Leadbetterella byssophila DSM 17132]|uniref:Carboxyl-terminal protease n=1 Tax=Leadbetterella byssophila (strain DSM 17132 / JCM 16389 / KACC 11308 / NBRC 106382 / 4M15) TaxID=649349 RepID=E4RXY8_LEAB4|nr:carboxy terminal-processing peptidase [Leadbetterella byssophila]ADQ19085.1 carboxyl-terminal protease [Leadbetterella byssophila DSM 17132]